MVVVKADGEGSLSLRSVLPSIAAGCAPSATWPQHQRVGGGAQILASTHEGAN